MKTFKEFIEERKSVGNIYHFTKIENLYGLLFDNERYNAEPLEFVSFNDTFSCTRDSCLASNPMSRDINIKNGHSVRIVLDGDKISDKFKIKPHNGLDDDELYKTPENNYIGKDYQEREEQITSKNGEFKMEKFIKRIDILNNNKSYKNINKIISKLDEMKINYSFRRKFQREHINEVASMGETHELFLESQNKSLKDILKEENIFIMVIGGVASGKSYFIDKNIKGKLPIVDIDEYTKKHSGGDWEKARKLVSKGIKWSEEELKKYFKNKESVINQGTGASIAGVKNKLTWANEAGMKTAIILVDVPLETALKRNQERAQKGDRNLIPDYKVQRTNTQARENFKEFSKMADFSLIVK